MLHRFAEALRDFLNLSDSVKKSTCAGGCEVLESGAKEAGKLFDFESEADFEKILPTNKDKNINRLLYKEYSKEYYNELLRRYGIGQ